MIAALDPASLLELDGPMFEAVEQAALERWTTLEELAALSVELQHAHYLAYLTVHGAKVKVPPLHVTRPGAAEPDGPPRLGAAAFAAEFGGVRA